MKKIYTEKIHQSTRFGLLDEDGRKTPCGTLWSDAQRNTFERLMNGGNNLSFMAWGKGWDVWGNEVECTAHLPMEETSCCG